MRLRRKSYCSLWIAVILTIWLKRPPNRAAYVKYL